MGFLSWFSGKKSGETGGEKSAPPAPPPPSAPPPFDPEDPLRGDARLRPLVDELRSLKFDATRAFLQSLTDTDERYIAAQGLARMVKAPGLLQSWATEGQHPLIRTVRGIACIETAWDARGSGWAKDVSTSQWGSFESWLDEAREDLAFAARNSGDAVPVVFQLVIEAAASDGVTLPGTFEEALSRAPASYFVHARRMWTLLWKWHGSHDEMFAFAHAARVKGGALPALLAHAHAERWLAFQQSDELATDEAKSAAAKEYLVNETVQADFDGTWQQTFGASGFVCPRAVAPAAAGAYAWYFGGFRERERTVTALKATRGYVDGWFNSVGPATLMRFMKNFDVQPG